MNPKPNSIWQQTWRVSRAFLAWLALFISIVFAVLFLGPMVNAPREPPGPLAVFIVGVTGASLLLFLWLFVRLSTRCWRNLRRTLMGLAVLATLTALFYTEENWRGKRAWENCKSELETKGEAIDWAAYFPAPVPDEQNIFKAPKMTEWFSGKGRTDLLDQTRFGTFNDFVRLHSPNILAEITVVSP